jgi:hypothetical protein
MPAEQKDDKVTPKNSLFDSLTENPYIQRLRIAGYTNKINKLKILISNNPNNNELKARLKIERENFKKFSPTRSLVLEMEENLDRYFQPLKFLIKSFVKILEYGVLLPHDIIFFVLLLPKIFLELLIIIHTGTGFWYLCLKYIENQYPQARAKYLDQLKDMDMDQATADMTDEEFIARCKRFTISQNPNMSGLTDEQYEEDYIKKDVLKIIYGDFPAKIWLNLIAKSFYEVLTQPLPQGKIKKALAGLLWLLRLLTSIPLFFLALVQTGLEVITKITLQIISEVIRPFILLGALFIANFPLILWDAPGYLIGKIKNCWCAPSLSSEDQEEQLLNSSHWHLRINTDLSESTEPSEQKTPSNPSQSSRPASSTNLNPGSQNTTDVSDSARKAHERSNIFSATKEEQGEGTTKNPNPQPTS